MSDLLLQSQKRIFDYMKKRALSFEQLSNRQILKYRKDHEKYSRRNFTESTIKEFDKTVFKSNIIYVADFHTYDQNLKNYLRILKLLSARKKKVLLALEMLRPNDFLIVQSYLDNHLTEYEFLEGINYNEAWRFPWTHYKAIFDFAKNNPYLKIIGINKPGTLLERDQYCAKIIAQEWKSDPQRTIAVLYGEYHLAPNKIPYFVKKELSGFKFKALTLHQNLDIPYWKILKKNKSLKHHTLFKFNDHEFCLLSAPPWMKYESMSYWYENLIDDPDYDLHGYIMETGLKSLSSNTVDNFFFICQQMIQFFQLPYKMNDLAFSLYDHEKLSFLQSFIKKHYKKPISKYLLKTIETNYSLILPGTGKIYCATYSANKLTKLAGQFLYQHFCLRHGVDITSYYGIKDPENFFAYTVLSHFHSYFLTKSINPYVKCDLYLDIKHKAKLNLEKQDRAAYHLALKILNKPAMLKNIINRNTKENISLVAKLIGELLAESSSVKIYQNPKSFDGIRWQRDYLIKEHCYLSLTNLMAKLLPSPWFKSQRKRYF